MPEMKVEKREVGLETYWVITINGVELGQQVSEKEMEALRFDKKEEAEEYIKWFKSVL